MTIKLIPCLALVFGGSCWVLSVSAADANALREVVKLSKTGVRVKEPFSVALRVENPTTTNQTVRVMNCSWQDEWQSSNPKFPRGGAECSKNFAVDVEIPPGGAYTNEAQILIYDLIPDKELSFRMGFTPIGSGKTFWSEEVKLKILPPVVWQHGTMIYQDRNHDGKIDWEVSGKTWMGRVVYPYKMVTNSVGDVMAVLETTGQEVDTYKVDTNHNGFYDFEYGAGGINGRIQWSTNIHERVPAVEKDFIPIQKEAWMDWWTE